MIRDHNFAALAVRDVEGLPLDLARLLAELLVLLVLEGEGELELVLAPLALRVELRAVAGRVLAHGVGVGLGLDLLGLLVAVVGRGAKRVSA